MTSIYEYYSVVSRFYNQYIRADGLLWRLSECVRLRRVMKSRAGPVSYGQIPLSRLPRDVRDKPVTS